MQKKNPTSGATRYFISDFVEIQRRSFFELLEKGIIEEFSKRNPITSIKKDIKLFFYPEYYKLTIPEYSPRQAIIKSKSYTSKLYLPVQLTDKKSNIIRLKWAYVGNLPLMTKRGHFILNGAARVIVNQIIRSPGIYYQEKLHETFKQKWSQKADVSYKRYYADLICLRGTWLRLEIDKDKNIWAQTKKGPKIPVFWFLIAMGLSERVIFNSVLEPNRLVQNLGGFSSIKGKSLISSKTGKASSASGKSSKSSADFSKSLYPLEETKFLKQKNNYCYVKNPPSAWKEIFTLLQKKNYINSLNINISEENGFASENENDLQQKTSEQGSLSSIKTTTDSDLNSVMDVNSNKKNNLKLKTSFLEQQSKIKNLESNIQSTPRNGTEKSLETLSSEKSRMSLKKFNAKKSDKTYSEQGRKWLFSKFMNPRAYDLGKQGRSAFNRKLGLKIDERQLTLTAQDLLYATDYLIKVEKGLRNLDDIDHLQNRRVRTSGELIQIQIGIALVRLEKAIRDKINKTSIQFNVLEKKINNNLNVLKKKNNLKEAKPAGISSFLKASEGKEKSETFKQPISSYSSFGSKKNSFFYASKTLTVSNLINNKAFNSALREFFGTSPLSQFMDQINPLSEITHKRRLSSMGPGGVTRDTATLAIRGIHPTHYGRICPIETPEGKNTGLVNSMTAYARVNPLGMLESPFYKVYKGIVLKTSGMFFLSAEQEEKTKLAAADLFVTPIGFLPNTNIPVKIGENFTKINRNNVEYIGVSPIQMISIATSLIPFLEHDDANRALMGSNMQRQAVPLIRPERPIVGTGLEPRAVSDSGHVIQSKFSGVVTYVSAEKIIVTTFKI
jgi:DNA-directed RNA polymerase beta subunit